ncbi:MAG TPA: 50S rRNA methyltransferase [Syntrophobacteraceae bacterium]|jgi:23S rRNA (uridine2552-2'-O)-methyltransferase|nr:50S rRNA methyltransferase [Syntrophobacteraceae bacterium]HBD07049.1 50S rRNA methyltransferase [Syntrophobacteraceae bacterium]
MPHKYQDHYFHRAKKDRYLARAVYKLEEIHNKHRLLRPGNRVLDLGAAPGSWMQLTAGIIGPNGFLVGVDLKKIEHPFPPHVVVLQGDIHEESFVQQLQREYAPFDVILSDMAPATSGIRMADSARSALLFERTLELVRILLRPQGHFLSKIFQGAEFHGLLVDVKKAFSRVKVVKPDASRKESKEIYILAMNYKGIEAISIH